VIFIYKIRKHDILLADPPSGTTYLPHGAAQCSRHDSDTCVAVVVGIDDTSGDMELVDGKIWF
jgi:hypothetical protein